MWKFYIITTLCIQLINGQCDLYDPCVSTTPSFYPQTNSPNSRNLPTHNENNKVTVLAPINPVLAQNNQISKQTRYAVNSKDLNLPFPSEVINSPTKSFNSKLFEIMSLTAQQQNFVYSPVSLQILLTFILAISEGKLSEELRQLLAGTNDRTYQTIINDLSLNTPPTKLILANKLYYDHQFGNVNQNVRNVASNFYASELETINFAAANKAANIINTWVSGKTHNLIRNIITPSTISPNTNAVLLNVIYFKSEWLNKFSPYDTQQQQFNVNRNVQVPVEMMYNDDVFRYGDFSDELQATVVELPYKTSDLTMMLILPNDIEGLPVLERKLSNYDLEKLSQRLKRELVTVKMPKFKVEFDMDMMKPLQDLGVNALFNNEGKINLFPNQQKPLTVDQVKHKSFISVNEAGTEAAAASFAKYIPLSIPINKKYFVADHPFIFVIRNSNAIFFIGHVIQF